MREKRSLIGGARYDDGSYDGLEKDGYYWTSTQTSPGSATGYQLNKPNGIILNQNLNKRWGLSCRCVQD